MPAAWRHIFSAPHLTKRFLYDIINHTMQNARFKTHILIQRTGISEKPGFVPDCRAVRRGYMVRSEGVNTNVRLLLAAGILLLLAGGVLVCLRQWHCAALSGAGALGCMTGAKAFHNGEDKAR